MAGRGPAPKDPSQRARRNKPPAPQRVIEISPSSQPDLPVSPPEGLCDVWPERTVTWWRMWWESPLSSDFTENDWSELMDTALLHAAYWSGDLSRAAELRLRVAKFGATPEDRARLRITFATAEQSESRSATARQRAQTSSRDRRGPLKAV